MTVEERLERLERKTGIIGSTVTRPKVGNQFWLKGKSSDWAVWAATEMGIVIINYKGEIVSHPWVVFDENIQDGSWQWSVLKGC